MITETIDTRHVEDPTWRCYHPAYAMVAMSMPEWAWDEDKLVVIGRTIDDPFPVRIPRGGSLWGTLKTMRYSPAFGEVIHSAIAMTEEEYLAEMSRRAAMLSAAVDCPEF